VLRDGLEHLPDAGREAHVERLFDPPDEIPVAGKRPEGRPPALPALLLRLCAEL
jgi:hypothetical protein